MSSPMKAKGVGELGICGAAAAVANAVYNATGVRVRDYPITLDKLIERTAGRNLIMSAMSTKSRQVSCAVMLLAVSIFGSAGDLAGQGKSQTVTRAGSQPSTKGPAEYFTGNVRVDPLFAANEWAPYSGALRHLRARRALRLAHPSRRASACIVTRAWACTQEWGEPVQEIRARRRGLVPAGRQALARRRRRRRR